MGVLIKNKVNYSGGKLLMSPECYSLEEKEIGCWTDGKPLYERTFHATSGPANSYNELDLGIASDSISMIKIKSCFIRNTFNGIDGVYHLGPYASPADQQFLGGLNPKSNGNYVLFYRVGPYCAGGDLTLTVQYTKATDQPGSGTWTPQGLLTVHYNTNEQVIGTWVDGSTLYEKTLYLANASISSGSSATMPTINGIKNVMIISGSCYDNNDQRYYPLPYIRVIDAESIKVQAHVANGSLNTYVFTNQSGTYALKDIYLTVRYTKATS